MMMKYRSEALMVIHQDAQGLYRLGVISNNEMKEYDKECLVQEAEVDYEIDSSKVMESQVV
jgi:DNA-binding transcriptional regulator YiaG